MEPRPGLMVTSNVRLSRLLGKGGMGSVWVADHLGLDTEVAVKFVDVKATKDPKVLARFKREAGIAAKLKSPHAVQTFDHGLSADGTPYIVMELIEGESLQEKLVRDRTLSLRECTLVVMQTAQVLAKAHKMGVVHRDIKPANLFLVDTGYELFVKLLDFGIAKHAGGITEVELTKTGTLLGSPLYMSPEQFVNVKGIDHRGDLWSLAVLVYQCLSGTHAFKGETLGQVIIAVTNCKYQPITIVRKGLSSALDAFFEKAFHRELDKRFQTAKELADAFAAAANSVEKESSPDVTGPRAALPSLTDIPLEATAELPDALAAGGFATGASPAVASSPGAPPNGLAAPPSGQTAELPEVAAIAPKRTSPAMTAEQAQTFSPAATTLDQEPAGKRSMLLVAIAAIVAVAGVAVAVMVGGFAGSSVPSAADSSAEEARGTEPQRATDDSLSAPASASAAEAEPSAEAALAEGDAAMPAASAMASASANVKSAASVVAAAPSPNTDDPYPVPAAKTSPKPKPIKQVPNDYDKGMGF